MVKKRLHKGAVENLRPEEKDELLARLRNEVDNLDEEIAGLLIKRFNASVEIGEIKRALGLAAYDALREKEIDENIDKLAEDPDIKKSLRRVYERIIDESRTVQKEGEK